MRRSLRWTWFGWYALILLIVLGGLGLKIHRQLRTTERDALKAELEAHGRAIAGAIEWDEVDGFELELDPTYLATFRSLDPDAPRFEVRGADGRTLYPPAVGTASERRVPPPVRVVRVSGPRGTTVRVRQSMQKLEARQAEFGWEVFWSCLSAFVIAMGVGWGMVKQVLVPVRRISETAARISASNPEERIDVARMEKELGSVATTLNEAFDRLQGAVDRQVRFTADASHELRTPLAVLKANVEWAERAERTPQEYGEVFDACLRATDRMTRTVEDLLALARSDATHLPLQKEAIDLAILVDETASFVASLASAEDVTVLKTGASAPIQGDPTRLREVLAGLVANAIRHAPPGGRVEMSTALVDGQAVVAVSDTGPGISQADLPHVFERFYRADTARSDDTGGNGLGLAIAKEVVELHGGTIEATNGPAGGAVFTIRIPSADV